MQISTALPRVTVTAAPPASPVPQSPADRVTLGEPTTGQKIWTGVNHVMDVAQTGLVGGVEAVLGSLGRTPALLMGTAFPVMLASSSEFRQRADWKGVLATASATSIGGALMGCFLPPGVALPASFALGAGLETARKLLS